MATQWLCRFFLHTAKCKVLFDVVYALARLKWNTLHFRLSMLTLTFSVCLNVMLSVFRHLYYHHHQSKDIMPNKFLFHPLCRSSYLYIVFFRLFNEYFFHYVPNSFSMFHSLFLMHVLYPSLASKKKMKIEHTQTHTENSIHFIHFVLWIFFKYFMIPNGISFPHSFTFINCWKAIFAFAIPSYPTICSFHVFCLPHYFLNVCFPKLLINITEMKY